MAVNTKLQTFFLLQSLPFVDVTVHHFSRQKQYLSRCLVLPSPSGKTTTTITTATATTTTKTTVTSTSADAKRDSPSWLGELAGRDVVLVFGVYFPNEGKFDDEE